MKLQGQHEVRRIVAKADGYAMAALLISLSIMALVMTAVMPVWKQTSQREKEAELVFRGQQYVRAIQLFQRKSGPGTYPPSVDLLVQQKFLRKKYKDPITNGDFQPLPATVVSAPIPPGSSAPGTQTSQTGAASGSNTTSAPPAGQPFTFGGSSDTTIPGGIAGVMSKSTDASIRIYNGQTHYNEWVFRFTPAAPVPGAGGAGGPAGPGQRGGQPPPGAAGPGGVGGRGTGRGARGIPGGPGAPPPPGGRGFTTTGGAGRGFQTAPVGPPVAPPAGAPQGTRPGPGD